MRMFKSPRLPRKASIEMIMADAARQLETGKQYPILADGFLGQLSGLNTALMFFGAPQQAAEVMAMWKELHSFVAGVKS